MVPIRDNGAGISLRAGEMEGNREGDLGYSCFQVVVPKSPDGFN